MIMLVVYCEVLPKGTKVKVGNAIIIGTGHSEDEEEERKVPA